MFKKTLTALVAALTLTSATFTTTQSAQAGTFGKVLAAGIVGVAVGAIAAGKARSQDQDYRPEYRPARGGYEGGCGFRNSPVFDEYGNRIGSRRVSAC